MIFSTEYFSGFREIGHSHLPTDQVSSNSMVRRRRISGRTWRISSSPSKIQFPGTSRICSSIQKITQVCPLPPFQLRFVILGLKCFDCILENRNHKKNHEKALLFIGVIDITSKYIKVHVLCKYNVNLRKSHTIVVLQGNYFFRVKIQGGQ